MLEKRTKEEDLSEEPMRPIILRLMGYPTFRGDNEFDQETVSPHWDAVLEQLISNPSEASYLEDENRPLDDALWIENDPVPTAVVVLLLRAFPKSLSARTFTIANENPNTLPSVLRLLRAADVDSSFTEERTELLQLMGFPFYKYDNDFNKSEIKPDWEAVRKRLGTHPAEALVHEDGCYPLKDALSIEWDPVPLDVVETLIRLAPDGLTDGAFITAAENGELDCDVLSFLFKADNKIREKAKSRSVKP